MTTVKTTKHLVKRPYGVSVTDLDIFSENVAKKQKKNQKLMKKKSTDIGTNGISKANSRKRKNAPKTTSKTLSNPDASQTFLSTNDSSSELYYYHPKTPHISSSADLPNSNSQSFPY